MSGKEEEFKDTIAASLELLNELARRNIVAISETEEFTSDVALDLAVEMIFLAADYDLYKQAIFEHQGEVTEATQYRDRRLEREAALFKAQSGDYTDIKELLRKLAARSLNEEGPFFHTKWLQMSEVIPDRGSPYFPPVPPKLTRP